jgi:hypothetical protein
MDELFASTEYNNVEKLEILMQEAMLLYSGYVFYSQIYGALLDSEFSPIIDGESALDLVAGDGPDYTAQLEEENLINYFMTFGAFPFDEEDALILKGLFLSDDTFQTILKSERVGDQLVNTASLDFDLSIVTNMEEIIAGLELRYTRDFDLDFGPSGLDLVAEENLTMALFGFFEVDGNRNDFNDNEDDVYYQPAPIGYDDYGGFEENYYGFTGQFDGNGFTLYNWKALDYYDYTDYNLFGFNNYEEFIDLPDPTISDTTFRYYVDGTETLENGGAPLDEYHGIWVIVNGAYVRFDPSIHFDVYNIELGLNHYGLFGFTLDADIRNLTLEDSIVKLTNAKYDAAYSDYGFDQSGSFITEVGLLVGHAENTVISNVTVKQAVPLAYLIEFTFGFEQYLDALEEEPTTYPNVEARIKQTGVFIDNSTDFDDSVSYYGEDTPIDTQRIGGLVGYSRGLIMINVKNSGDVVVTEGNDYITTLGTGDEIGGLVGQSDDHLTIYGSQVTSRLILGGATVGGLVGEVGYDDETTYSQVVNIENSLVFGTLITSNRDAAGLVSRVEGDYVIANIVNSYFVGSLKSLNYVYEEDYSPGSLAGFINDIDIDDQSYSNFVEINIIDSYAIIVDAWLYDNEDNSTQQSVAGFINEDSADEYSEGIKVNILDSFAALNYVYIESDNEYDEGNFSDSDSNVVVGLTRDREATIIARNVFFSQLPSWYPDMFNPSSSDIKGTYERFNRDVIGLNDTKFVEMFLSEDFHFNNLWDVNSVWAVGNEGLDVHDNPLFEVYSSFFVEEGDFTPGERLIPQLRDNELTQNTLTNWKHSLHQRLFMNFDLNEDEFGMYIYLTQPKTTLFLEEAPVAMMGLLD